jgi:glycosyltransferase involved in cell wall biosynthesis
MTGRQPIRVAHLATVDITHRFLLLPQLVGLRDEGFEVTAVSAAGAYVGDLEAHGIRHVAWRSATRSWAPRSDARALRELVALFRSERFDVVHTHTPKAGLLGRIAARVTGVPVIVNTVHGYWASPEHPLRRRAPVLGLEWLGARFSNAELFQSGEDLEWARRRHVVRPRQGVYLGNGTDVTAYDASAVSLDRAAALRAELGIDEGDLVVGAVGRMVAEKGYREFFHAARTVRSASPRVRFLVVGETDLSKDDAIGPDEIAEASADVIFTGWRTDVRDLLGLMDVFVLASWREGMPRSAIEAAAMGRALVLTNIRGCREVARDGVEGFLVPVRDPQALATAIKRLVDDEELRAAMGMRARRRAVEAFDERRVVAVLLRVYGQLLEPRLRPAARGSRERLPV